MFDNNSGYPQGDDRQQDNDYRQSSYQPPAYQPEYRQDSEQYGGIPKRRPRAIKLIGKAVLAIALVVCISVASVTGYVWMTGSANPAGGTDPLNPAAAAGSESTIPYSKANYTLAQSEEALTTPEIFIKASPWVVSIECTYEIVQGGGWFGQSAIPSTSSGTGIIISADGYILTNHHVVDGASIISVKLSGGNEYEAKIIGMDEKTDISVIKIEASGLSAAEFGDSSQIIVGEPAIVIGNPLGYNLADTLTQGVISATERQIEFTDSNNSPFYITLIQTDAAVNPGNSGGPLINSRGQVIGVVNSKIMADEVEGIGFAVPANIALSIANDLIANGKVTIRPMLGITVRAMSEAQAKQFNEYYKDSIAAGTATTARAGIIVESVTEGSSAANAGMKAGDEIVAFNGVKVSTTTELNYEKEKCFVGDTATITIERDGQQMDLTVYFTAGDAA